MEETTIEPIVNVVGDKEYNNFYFKRKNSKNKETGKMELLHAGVPKDNYIVIKKLSADTIPIDGKEVQSPYGTSFLFLIEHNGVKGSVWLNEKHAKPFRAAGDEGDLVKVWVEKESFVNDNTGLEVVYDKVKYEVVQ